MPKTKGAHVINAVKILRGQRARALELLPPRLHHYLEERILASSWYPMAEQVELLRAIAAMMEGSADPWLDMGRGTARMDFTGIYKNRLREDDPARSLEVMSAMWRSTNDTGDLSVTIDAPGKATILLHGYDLRSTERCRMVDGYLMELLTMASALSPRVHHPECTARGAVDCIWRASWS